jgi:flagellar motor switch protein FliN/FliY
MQDKEEGLGSSSVGDVNLQTVYDIPLQVSVILGKTEMKVSQLVKLNRGAVIELDRKVGEPIDLYVNDRLVAKGEIVLVENRIGLTITELFARE